MDRVHAERENLPQALIDIGQELSSTIDLSELLNRILRVSREVFRFENAIIRLVDQQSGTLVTAAAYGYDEAAIRPIAMEEGIMGQVARSGEPILIADLARLPDYVPGICDARSELAVPMVAREKVIGVYNVESPLPGAFRPEDIAPLMTMATQAAIAIENARLYENLKAVSGRYHQLHQFNERILHSVDLGIYTVDAALRITSWNRAMAEMSGLCEEQTMGKALFELFPALEKEGFAERIREVLQTGRGEKVRLTHRDLQGNLRFQKRRLAPLVEAGKPAGVVVIVEDITEFRRLLDQVIQSEKLVEVGRLSAGIAHEINNPLAVIAYAVDLLLREENLTPFQQELIERITGETERLQSLTGSLLSFSRPRRTQRRRLDLNQVLRDVLRLLHYEVRRRGIDVSEEYAVLPPVSADPDKLKQVFINLILNASQAMQAGGKLRLATRVVDGEVEVTVVDSGPGIAPEIRERIFEPFFSSREEGEGTGLGLYICRNIVGEHGGRLDLDTRPGEGATFRLRLPAQG